MDFAPSKTHQHDDGVAADFDGDGIADILQIVPVLTSCRSPLEVEAIGSRLTLSRRHRFPSQESEISIM